MRHDHARAIGDLGEFDAKLGGVAVVACVSVFVGDLFAVTKATVREFLLDTWLPAVKPTLRTSTYEGYKRIVETRIVSRIGDLRLQRLSPADLQRLYAELLEDGKLNGKVDGKRVGLSAKSVLELHRDGIRSSGTGSTARPTGHP